LTEAGRIITLIKPQFEVGRGLVGRGGIVHDPAQHQRVIEEVNAAAEALGLRVVRVVESPIRGADGNREFLALYEKDSR
jgi:23S rRNA (cytidine1920-2'-O)/16S rRNA (cytidine1409-2'-O)-methyltransferase